MFASVTFRLPAPLRRAGAYLKAFALLEDARPMRRTAADGRAPLAGEPTADARRAPAHTARQSPSAAPSHQHRRPPRTPTDRLSPRRPGIVPAGLQPCTTPIAALQGVGAVASRTRCSRSGSRHPAG